MGSRCSGSPRWTSNRRPRASLLTAPGFKAARGQQTAAVLRGSLDSSTRGARPPCASSSEGAVSGSPATSRAAPRAAARTGRRRCSTTPSSERSRMPRTMSAGDSRATRRYRFQTPTLQITLTSPVSSSRFMKVMPLAVAGRCRCVTTPPTSTRRPDSAPCSSAADSAPRSSSSRPQVPHGMVVGRDPGRPQVGDQPLRVRRHREQRRLHRDHGALEVLGAVLRRRAGVPQRLPHAHPEALERAGRRERLELRGAEPDPPHEVGHVQVVAAGVPLGDDALWPVRCRCRSPRRARAARRRMPSRRCAAKSSGRRGSNGGTGGCSRRGSSSLPDAAPRASGPA